MPPWLNRLLYHLNFHRNFHRTLWPRWSRMASY